MVTDPIFNPTVTASAGTIRDFAKKKRTNRSAKLKQCKLDARREQWLSKVKNKGLKADGDNDREPSVVEHNEAKRSLEKLAMDNNNHQESDWDSPLNSPTSGSSILGSTDLGTIYIGGSSSSSRSYSSTGCYSGTVTDGEEDNDDGGHLDDWETVADALAADEKQQNTDSEPTPVNVSDSVNKLIDRNGSARVGKPECLAIPRSQENSRAWRADDASRPQSLPNLSKQHSFPMNSNRHCNGGNGFWTCKRLGTTVPSSCPICCEDLDMTDTSFLPCPCGFRLCLFCHKRILEEDGRCPGCRKVYDQEPVACEVSGTGGSFKLQLARSFSMIARS